MPARGLHWLEQRPLLSTLSATVTPKMAASYSVMQPCTRDRGPQENDAQDNHPGARGAWGAAMMGDILPSHVAVVEAFADLADVMLYPDEEAVVANAVDKRRREFATGRACARAALAGLGLPPVSIVPGPGGAPQWPSGVVGSITHCAGYRAAAVARESEFAAIGLDAEPHDELPRGVLEAVTSPGERARVATLAATMPEVRWDRLLFSAKESVYKAWFPLTGRWLGFEDACVDFCLENRTFTARFLVDGPAVNGETLTAFAGRWLVANGLITTAIVIRAVN
jgi:4'-phosphopantetheinyl transferase EntD